MLAVPTALLLLSCDGGGGSSGPTFPPSVPGGDGHVSVTVPAGAAFYGFDVSLLYDAAIVAPEMPIAASVVAAGLGAGSTCTPVQTGNELRIGCAKAAAMNGPGEIATFSFTYPGRVPTAADFDVDCLFYDENGAPVALACAASWVN
jgi:hypothetical protein